MSKPMVRRFNRDEKASIAHALMHLTANKIADDDDHGHSGWYCGNREQFVTRHKKAITLMRSLLTPDAHADLSAAPADKVRRVVGNSGGDE